MVSLNGSPTKAFDKVLKNMTGRAGQSTIMVGYNFTDWQGKPRGGMRIIAFIPEVVTAWDNFAYRRVPPAVRASALGPVEALTI